MGSFGDRLKAERERLGMNQTDFAELAGTTRKSQFNYESNLRRPDADYLAAVAAAGVDVLYVLTGQRSMPVESQLSTEQQRLLEAFNTMTPEQKKTVLDVGRLLTQPKPDGKTG
ncbi:helix-turn-helix transcriptional regulator [Brenneria populi subsp. brevivirga]|uniref:helix-turn-helix domain-containing protein n=1 Tax=Brenneria populi TaxID=1505588 RepID=UPI002E185E28|nr:helix-turn-helix transcriptional regulator [Brenneria populi subsp. brevivirga]